MVSRGDERLACIGFDNELAGRLAAQHLLSLGHRNRVAPSNGAPHRRPSTPGHLRKVR
jgi:DNA-binding LacI/PurR family transcriptional regulator